MKTSWNELRLSEDYLSGKLHPEERVLFEARLLIEPGLEDELYWQRRTYGLVRAYGRQELRNQIRSIEKELFEAPEHSSFTQWIKRFFTR